MLKITFLENLVEKLQDELDVDDRLELLSLAEDQLIDERVRLEEKERQRRDLFGSKLEPQRRRIE